MKVQQSNVELVLKEKQEVLEKIKNALQ